MIEGLRLRLSSELLRNGSFLRLWLSQAIAVAALYALNLAALMAVAERTLSVTQTGLVILASIVPAFLGSLVSGALVDRFGRVRVLLGVHLVRGLAALGFYLSVAALWGDYGPAPIYAILVVVALITQFATPAELSLLPDLVNPSQLVAANSVLQSSVLVAEGLGVVVIGPVLARVGGPGAVGVAGAALFAIAFALAAPLRGGQSSHTPTGGHYRGLRSVGKELQAGWLAIARDRILLVVTLQITVAGVMLLILLSMLPSLASARMGLQITDISLLVIPGGVGFGIGALLIGRLGNRFNSEQWINGGLLAFGFATAMVVIVSGGAGLVPLLLFAAAILGVGVALAFAIIPARAVIQSRPDPVVRGRVIAAQLALANACALVPLLLSGVLADRLGVRPVMLALAVLAAGSGCAGLNQTKT